MKVVNVSQMRSVEQACFESGISPGELMRKAGLAVAQEARILLKEIADVSIVVLVGPGNNGGDGLVAARHLQSWGAKVTCYQATNRSMIKPEQTLAQGVISILAEEDQGYNVLEDELTRARLVIDALLGTGSARPLTGVFREVVLRVQQEHSRTPSIQVLSVDLPTGVNADTGETDPVALKADITVALGYAKVGHIRFPGAEKIGKLKVVDIGIPPGLVKDVDMEIISRRWVKRNLPNRDLGAHKGTFGHLLVVAGSKNYIGAAYLACQSAMRAGAGLVTLASPQGIYPMLASKLTEIIHIPLPEDVDGRIHSDSAKILKEKLSQYNSLLLGCGLGQSHQIREFLELFLFSNSQSMPPMVIDADGLNNLVDIPDWWKKLDGPVVLTPHPGEMSRLTRISITDLQQSRDQSARKWARQWAKTVVLKGAYSVIASPDDACKISPFANPLLASGGTGDVLSGVIGGFLAQGLLPQQAACCGVYVHGLAAESLGSSFGDSGALASDLIMEIPKAVKQVKESC